MIRDFAVPEQATQQRQGIGGHDTVHKTFLAVQATDLRPACFSRRASTPRYDQGRPATCPRKDLRGEGASVRAFPPLGPNRGPSELRGRVAWPIGSGRSRGEL